MKELFKTKAEVSLEEYQKMMNCFPSLYLPRLLICVICFGVLFCFFNIIFYPEQQPLEIITTNVILILLSSIAEFHAKHK